MPLAVHVSPRTCAPRRLRRAPVPPRVPHVPRQTADQVRVRERQARRVCAAVQYHHDQEGRREQEGARGGGQVGRHRRPLPEGQEQAQELDRQELEGGDGQRPEGARPASD